MKAPFSQKISRFANVLFVVALVVSMFSIQGNVLPVQAQPQKDTTPITFYNLTQVSPNEQYIAYVTADNLEMAGSTIWLGAPQGPNSTILVTGDSTGHDYWVTNPVWSPDSGQIAYVKAIKTGDKQYFIQYRFEIWVVNRDGSNNHMLTDTSLFNPILGYGGKTDLAWKANNEIEFFDQAVTPVKKYTISVDSLAVSEVLDANGKAITNLPAQANIDEVTQYYQKDWNDPLYYYGDDGTIHTSGTIATDDCAITSVAMVLDTYHYQISGARITPRTLDDWLISIKSPGCWPDQAVLSGIDNAAITVDTSNLQSPNLEKIKTKISSKVPVILWYYKPYQGSTIRHFVVATGYNDSNDTINVNDPTDGYTTLDFYNVGVNGIQGMVIIEGDITPQTTSFVKTSPANGATNVDARYDVSLSWTNPGNVYKFKYCYYSSDSGVSNFCDLNSPGTWQDADPFTATTVKISPSSAHPLIAGKNYQWQVGAKKNDNSFVLAENGWWSFKTTGGVCVISGYTGVSGATLSYTDGTSKTATADGNGYYSFSVTSGWSSTVTPSKTGYTFSPVNRTYTNVQTNQTNQNYTATLSIHTISGSAGVGGATLSYTDGTPKTAIADGNGHYSFIVSNNWSGMVTPSLARYIFYPVNITYSNVVSDQVNQNYTATLNTPRISGNAGVAGASLSYFDVTTKTATADGWGNYAIIVPKGWSGTVTPSKTGYLFNPVNRTYANITIDMGAENYSVPPVTYDDFNTSKAISGIPDKDLDVNTISATTAIDDPSISGCNAKPGLATVWYVYTPSANQEVHLDTFGSNYDTLLSVWTGSRGSLLQVTCNDDSGGTTQSSVWFNATTGTPYYIEVGQWNGVISGTSAKSLPVTPGGTLQFHVTSFSDVPGTGFAWDYIEALYHAGITGGCASSPRLYCPDGSVTRAQMAVFLLRGIHGSAYTPPAATGTVFTDVPLSNPYAAWIERLSAEGITSGCGGGNYCPDASVTRAQMAVFLLRAEHTSAYTPPAATGTLFVDVPLSNPYGAWIERLSAEGITSGCGGSNYCPNNSVTRAQIAVFLVRIFAFPLPPFP